MRRSVGKPRDTIRRQNDKQVSRHTVRYQTDAHAHARCMKVSDLPPHAHLQHRAQIGVELLVPAPHTMCALDACNDENTCTVSLAQYFRSLETSFNMKSAAWAGSIRIDATGGGSETSLDMILPGWPRSDNQGKGKG